VIPEIEIVLNRGSRSVQYLNVSTVSRMLGRAGKM